MSSLNTSLLQLATPGRMQSLPTHLLAIIGQYLSVREKVTGLMQLSRSGHQLHALAFAHDSLALDHPAACPHSSLPTITRLIPHLVYHYASPLSADGAAADELLALLRPTSPAAADSFPRLRSLALVLPYPKQPPADRGAPPEPPLYHMSAQISTFPALRSVRLAMDGNGYSHTSWADPIGLRCLQLLPSLRCLLLERVQLSFETLMMLASLPLERLDAEQCWLWHPSRSAYRPPSEPQSLLTACRALRLPMTAACDDIAEELLIRFQARASQHPDGAEGVQELAYGSSPSAATLQRIVSLASLTRLELLYLCMPESTAAADLSLLYTADMRPALPRLRHFAFPLDSLDDVPGPPAAPLQRVHTAVTLLSVYSAQLRSLSLTAFSPDELLAQLHAASACRRLQQLAVYWRSDSIDRIDHLWQGEQSPHSSFVALRSLRLHRVPVTAGWLSAMLRFCPVVRRFRLQSALHISREDVAACQQLFPHLRHWQCSPCTVHHIRLRCFCHRLDLEPQTDNS